MDSTDNKRFKNYGSTNPLTTAPLEQKSQMQFALKINPTKNGIQSSYFHFYKQMTYLTTSSLGPTDSDGGFDFFLEDSSFCDWIESGSLFFFSTLWNSITIVSKTGNNWCLNRLWKK